jgi:hypothetical protein
MFVRSAFKRYADPVAIAPDQTTSADRSEIGEARLGEYPLRNL